MDFSRLDFSLFRKAEVSALADPAVLKPTLPAVQHVPNTRKSKYLKDAYSKESKPSKEAEIGFGLEHFSQALEALSHQLRVLHRASRTKEVDAPLLENELFPSTIQAAAFATTVLGKTSGMPSGQKIQMKASLRGVSSSLSESLSDSKKALKPGRGQPEARTKELLAGFRSGVESARKDVILLRREVEKLLAEHRSRFDEPSHVTNFPDSPLKRSWLQPKRTLRPVNIEGSLRVACAQFKAQPVNALLSQGSPNRDAIVELLFKERNLEGEESESV